MTSGKFALITGGELRNKGAQAMSFIAIMEARKRFPELEPILVSNSDAVPHVIGKLRGRQPRKDFENLNFPITHSLNLPAYKSATKGDFFVPGNAKATIENVLLRKTHAASLSLYENAALCIDISGFAFGDKWGFKRCMAYLDKLEVLHSLNVPFYLMPQSFGPFRFDKPQYDILQKRAQKLLSSARIIFPREKDGLKSLAKLAPKANLTASNDLVLQNSRIDLRAIFKSPPPLNEHLPEPDVKTVGIVPNERTYDHGDKATIDALYKDLVAYLLSRQYNVALIRHAFEDLKICERIKSLFEKDDRVQVFGEDRYCFEYDELFSRCDFLIASRFHSIVHAYRQGAPCVALGWAVKYHELLDLCGQSFLVHDATSPNITLADIKNSVDYVIENRDELSEQIRITVQEAQQSNVFDLVEADFRSWEIAEGR